MKFLRGGATLVCMKAKGEGLVVSFSMYIESKHHLTLASTIFFGDQSGLEESDKGCSLMHRQEPLRSLKLYP